MRRGGRVFLLLGILLVALVAIAAFFFLPQLTTPQQPQTQLIQTPTVVPRVSIVTANIDIPANTVLTDTETFLRLEEIPEPEFNANQNQYFTSVAELQNFVTLRAILAQERLTRADVVEAGLSLKIPEAQPGQPRPKAIVFEVDNLSGVADQIKPGDFVDLVASFAITRTEIRPSTGAPDLQLVATLAPGQPTPTPGVAYVETEFVGLSTKTLVQNVQVLDIRKPAAPAATDVTPTPGGSTVQDPNAQGPPETGPDGQPVQSGGSTTSGDQGNTFNPNARWLLILAVTDQQAEAIAFSQQQARSYALVLRGRGDRAFEGTIGVTLDLLISRYGLPVPVPVGPAVGPVQQLTPLPATAVPPTITP